MFFLNKCWPTQGHGLLFIQYCETKDSLYLSKKKRKLTESDKIVKVYKLG